MLRANCIRRISVKSSTRLQNYFYQVSVKSNVVIVISYVHSVVSYGSGNIPNQNTIFIFYPLVTIVNILHEKATNTE